MVLRPNNVNILGPLDVHQEKQLGCNGTGPRDVLYATNGRAKVAQRPDKGARELCPASVFCDFCV